MFQAKEVGLLLQEPPKGSTQGGTWAPKVCIKTIALLNTTYSSQTPLQILNLDLIKH